MKFEFLDDMFTSNGWKSIKTDQHTTGRQRGKNKQIQQQNISITKKARGNKSDKINIKVKKNIYRQISHETYIKAKKIKTQLIRNCKKKTLTEQF